MERIEKLEDDVERGVVQRREGKRTKTKQI